MNCKPEGVCKSRIIAAEGVGMMMKCLVRAEAHPAKACKIDLEIGGADCTGAQGK